MAENRANRNFETEKTANTPQVGNSDFSKCSKSATYNFLSQVWKACKPPKGFAGSNPVLSAEKRPVHRVFKRAMKKRFKSNHVEL